MCARNGMPDIAPPVIPCLPERHPGAAQLPRGSGRGPVQVRLADHARTAPTYLRPRAARGRHRLGDASDPSPPSSDRDQNWRPATRPTQPPGRWTVRDRTANPDRIPGQRGAIVEHDHALSRRQWHTCAAATPTPISTRRHVQPTGGTDRAGVGSEFSSASFGNRANNNSIPALYMHDSTPATARRSGSPQGPSSRQNAGDEQRPPMLWCAHVIDQAVPSHL